VKGAQVRGKFENAHEVRKHIAAVKRFGKLFTVQVCVRLGALTFIVFTILWLKFCKITILD
jgi:hypothetical protein